MKTIGVMMFILLSVPVYAQDISWQQRTLDLINEERANANIRELILYGEYQYGPRLPLEYNYVIEESEQWWCNALENTRGKLFDHFGYVNDRPRNGIPGGFLIEGPRNNGTFSNRQIGNIWLPSYNTPGQTFWVDRLRYLGVVNWGSSENGVLLDTSNSSPEEVVSAWFHGYNDDPRKAQYHYSNLVWPLWTDYGVAQKKWAKGKTTTFSGFIRRPGN